LGYHPAQSLYGELTDIINSYIDAGVISAKKLEKPAVILRELTGQIKRWEPGAKQIYGWEADTVAGNITHTVLNTEFPQPLDEINSSLLRDRVWHGTLTHTTKSGERVQVQSRWEITPATEVIETNWPVTTAKKTGFFKIPSLASVAPLVGGIPL
jgi:PAS domain-containing protein